MNTHDLIKQKVDFLPDDCAQEVVDFIDFLLQKKKSAGAPLNKSKKNAGAKSLYESLIEIASAPLEDPDTNSFSSEDIDSVLYNGETVR